VAAFARRGVLALVLGWLLAATLAAPALAKAPSPAALAAYLQEDKTPTSSSPATPTLVHWKPRGSCHNSPASC